MAAPTALTLSAKPRTELHRHAHALRRRGLVPGVLYGHNVEPQTLEVDARTLERVWRSAGRSHLVDLTLDGGRPRKVLIRELQVDPRSAGLVHVDLFAVNLREKLTVDVPVVPTGESPAVAVEKVGVLQQILTTIKVECLPGDIPAQLTADISGLLAVDDGIHISDLELPQGVALAPGVNADELVLKVAPVRVAIEEEEAEAPEGEAEEGAVAEGEPEASAEGE
ncbi:MAG TPA: 50S ribosomal protein L25 [Candidatus Dormibacteraeota bacterium]